jgi:hypothetical protein
LEFVMISSTLALLLAAAAMQPSDTTRATREAYTGCLRAFVDRSVDARMSRADFATAFPQACPQQEAAYRAAVIAREVASRMSRADAAESASTEIEDARFNFRERYDMAMPASAQAAAAPAAAAPTATATAPTPQPTAGATTPQ